MLHGCVSFSTQVFKHEHRIALPLIASIQFLKVSCQCMHGWNAQLIEVGGPGRLRQDLSSSVFVMLILQKGLHGPWHVCN